MTIIEGREGHRFWKNPPANIHRKMYIWHCTNPIEVQNGVAPELIELGPYVYRYLKKKKSLPVESKDLFFSFQVNNGIDQI